MTFRKEKLMYMERAKREMLVNTFIKEVANCDGNGDGNRETVTLSRRRLLLAFIQTMTMTLTLTLTLTTIMEQAGMEAEDMEKMLFDLEIGFLHRTIWTMLCLHFDPKVSNTIMMILSIMSTI